MLKYCALLLFSKFVFNSSLLVFFTLSTIEKSFNNKHFSQCFRWRDQCSNRCLYARLQRPLLFKATSLNKEETGVSHRYHLKQVSLQISYGLCLHVTDSRLNHIHIESQIISLLWLSGSSEKTFSRVCGDDDGPYTFHLA